MATIPFVVDATLAIVLRSHGRVPAALAEPPQRFNAGLPRHIDAHGGPDVTALRKVLGEALANRCETRITYALNLQRSRHRTPPFYGAPRPLTLHSMTSSARSSSDRGIVSPSAFAAFRLMTSSNFVGCSMGRLAGLAPLRSLSTYMAALRYDSASAPRTT